MCCQKHYFCLKKYYYILILKTLKLVNYKPGSWIYHDSLLECEACEVKVHSRGSHMEVFMTVINASLCKSYLLLENEVHLGLLMNATHIVPCLVLF